MFIVFIPLYNDNGSSSSVRRQQKFLLFLQYFTRVFICCVRISDRGGGIRHDIAEKIWEYGFTSPGYQGGQKSGRSHDWTRIPDGLFDELMVNRSAGKMHGYLHVVIY